MLRSGASGNVSAMHPSNEQGVSGLDREKPILIDSDFLYHLSFNTEAQLLEFVGKLITIDQVDRRCAVACSRHGRHPW